MRAYGLSNMVLLDENNRPTRYDTQYDILENFYEQRLPYYYKRKELCAQQIEKRCDFLVNKMKFIKLKNEGKIVIEDRKDADIIASMIEQGIVEEYVDDLLKTGVGSFSREKVAKLAAELEELKLKFEKAKTITPEEIWKSDLEELKEQYHKFYKKETKKSQKDPIKKASGPVKKRKQYQRKKKV